MLLLSDASHFSDPFQPYNSLLSLNQLVENSDMTVCLDNEALYGPCIISTPSSDLLSLFRYDICVRTLKTPNPSFSHLNKVGSTCRSWTTESIVS